MIIFRYLSREIYQATTAVTGVLLLIFLCHQFVRFLAKAAQGKLGFAIVFNLLAIQIPYLLGLLLPAGFFLGILLDYGRLYAEHEMTILRCSGMSQGQLVKQTLCISLPVMALVGLLLLWITPHLRAYQERLRTNSQAETLFQTAVPGRFQLLPGGLIYYIEELTRDHKSAKQVFVAKQNKQGDDSSWSVLSAEVAREELDQTYPGHFIVAEKGYRYFGEPGSPDFRVLQFAKYGMRLDDEVPDFRRQYMAMTNVQLWEKRDEDKHAMPELQWRLVMPLSVPILALLAVPLSYVQPRKGRFAKLLPAILLYTIYGNMMFVSRSWLEQGTISPVLGMWWLPFCLLIRGFCLLTGGPVLRQSRQLLLRWT